MSWLLVAVIPGLLMLAAVGLERLETGLHDDTVTAADVAAFFAQAEAGELTTLARDGMGEALDSLQRRRAASDAVAPGIAEPAVSARGRAYSHANPQVHPPRQANRV